MSRKLLAATVLLGAGILTLVFALSSPTPVYARSVSEFLAHPVREQTVRVEGTLVHGSLWGGGASCDYRFRLADRVDPGSQLSVHYPSCVVPDGFRDVPGVDLRVAVEGQLCASCHRFEASQVMARSLTKCELKYLEPRPVETPPPRSTAP